jgi:hypothetical protein
MPSSDKWLSDVLNGYSNFLRQKNLVSVSKQSYLVR